jgi:DNA topoisomerase-2
MPYFRGFTGTSSWKSDSSFVTTGVINVKARKHIIEISELPCRKWTSQYKTFLIELAEKGVIKSFSENHTNDRVNFEISYKRGESLDALVKDKKHDAIIQLLMLSKEFKMGNMHAFDENDVIRNYITAEEIAEAHHHIRLNAYELRKELILEKLRQQEAIANNKSRFVHEINSGNLEFIRSNGISRSKLDFMSSLKIRGFESFTEITNKANLQISEKSHNDEKDFDYLLNLPIQSLTEEKSVELKAAAEVARKQLNDLNRKTARDLWRHDLDVLASKAEDLKLL